MLYFIISIITSLGFIYVYIKFNKAKIKFNFKFEILFVLAMFVQSLMKYYSINFVSSISYFIFFPIFYYILCPLPKIRLIFYTIVIWIYGMILDLIIMLVLSFIFLLFKVNIYNNYFIIIPSIILCLLLFIIGNLKIITSLTNFLYKCVCKIKFYDLILCILSIFILFAAFVFSVNIQKIKVGILLLLTVFSILLVFITIIKMKFLDFEYNLSINILRENNNFYIKMDNDNHLFRHNLLAHLLAIKSVSNKKSRELINDLILKLNFNVDFLNQMKKIPYGLTGIIYEKIVPYANKLNVKLDNKIDYDIFDVLKARRYNVLVEKLILMLDNALEGSLLSIEKIVIINIYSENNRIIVEIKNSFRNDIDIESLGQISYSTKSKNRGFGLFSILRNNEVYVDVKIINNMFVAKLTALKKVV